MNLEIFQHIDDVVELFEGKRDVYKLIAEEIKEYFDDHVFDQSKYTLNLIYRIKTVESIREKLLCYFHQLSDKAGSLSFTLPFSLSTLADYIATDRSAMMRELKRMREEGLLQSDGRRFTLSQ